MRYYKVKYGLSHFVCKVARVNSIVDECVCVNCIAADLLQPRQLLQQAVFT